MKTPDMAKENNFLLREAVKAAQMGYFDHLAAGGKCDPAEERWIEALTAGADAITHVAVLESRLAQVERERDAAVEILYLLGECDGCKYCSKDIEEEPCKSCRRNWVNGCEAKDNWEWSGGVCEENTKEGADV